MGIKLKLTTIGNSTGVVLPKDVLSKLNVKKGDALFLSETPDGYSMSPYDDEFARQFEAGGKVMRKYRDVLRELAK